MALKIKTILVTTICLGVLSGIGMAQQNTPAVSQFERIFAEASRIYRNESPLSGMDLQNEVGKCGLRLRFEINKYWPTFTEKQRQELQELLAVSQSETYRIVGHFKIFYDTSSASPRTPALIAIDSLGICRRVEGTSELYIDSVGKFFNEAWNYQIDTLGYSAPPVNPDGYYYVNVVDFGLSGYYGETAYGPTPIIPGPPPRYLSYINIDNDFCDLSFLSSRGIPGLKVTAAHEFHHAIQLGSYGEWVNDFYFYEITSTWMEDVVYNDVNDYYQYIRGPYQSPSGYQPRGQFSRPDISFTATSGLIQYSRAIWGKFIEKRYGTDIMRQTWEHMRNAPSLASIDATLNSNGSSLRQAFLEWTFWNSQTGSNADTVQFYTEGKQYPAIRNDPEITYTGPSRSFADSIEALSSVYHPVCLLASTSASCDTSPKMLSIITNLSASSSGNGILYGFRYDISSIGDGSYKQLSNGVFVRISVSDPENWSSQEIQINADSSSRPIPRLNADVVVFPNPFRPSGSQLNFGIPFDSMSQSTASISIFSSSMDRIWSYEAVPQLSTCGYCLQWDGHDNNGNIISTGTYFFVITINEKHYIGKFAVIKK